MNVRELIDGHKAVFSFEFFPPKTQEDAQALFQTISTLKTLEPSFVSVTHTQSGGDPLKTAVLADKIKEDHDIEPMAHFTCIAHSRAEVKLMVEHLRQHNIHNVLALRGDIPTNSAATIKREYHHASELVRELSALGGFCIGVAGYPEKHPEAPSLEADIARLKEKVDAGASFVITQLFFDNADYFSFVAKCVATDIRVPIVPGIMPITSYKQLKRFSEMCGTRIPPQMAEDLEKIKDDSAAIIAYGVEYAYKQCWQLLNAGVPGLHFYTLNRSHSTLNILRRLKEKHERLRP
ncbi:MAG TPA: methylenetetrahydrofolate reductase [NAD(P)H] [Elusimicrobiales bacterium]|nr:methylenetetrahydrofolate reductase [NAD(P)H] [Elusimicrobiales bacterium]